MYHFSDFQHANTLKNQFKIIIIVYRNSTDRNTLESECVVVLSAKYENNRTTLNILNQRYLNLDFQLEYLLVLIRPRIL